MQGGGRAGLHLNSFVLGGLISAGGGNLFLLAEPMESWFMVATGTINFKCLVRTKYTVYESEEGTV